MSHACTACPLCSASRVQVHVAGASKGIAPCTVGSSRGSISTCRILRCRECGFGFSEYRPSDDELASLYQEMDTHVYEAEREGRKATAQAHLNIVQRYVEHTGRLLDVGCASGLFLQYAMKAGWEVAGVEPSKTLYAQARDNLGPAPLIHCSPLQSASFPASSFDVITLWDVLEHVNDHIAFLRLCASLLRPHGRVFANVPNLDSVQSRVLGSHWPLLLAEYLNYFTPASIQLCGAKAGLRWVGSCRRPAVFSTDYVLYRLEQHRIPGSRIARKLIGRVGWGTRCVSLYLGEICSVWSRSLTD